MVTCSCFLEVFEKFEEEVFQIVHEIRSERPLYTIRKVKDVHFPKEVLRSLKPPKFRWPGAYYSIYYIRINPSTYKLTNPSTAQKRQFQFL